VFSAITRLWAAGAARLRKSDVMWGDFQVVPSATMSVPACDQMLTTIKKCYFEAHAVQSSKYLLREDWTSNSTPRVPDLFYHPYFGDMFRSSSSVIEVSADVYHNKLKSRQSTAFAPSIMSFN